MKKTTPKVSVIVPVYNVAPYLARCLDSLVGQTLRDIEIICIDDKSTDNSLEILHTYANQDPRVRVIALSQNSGVSTARNAGIDAARGEYLGFVDSDDFVDTDFYEKLYTTAHSADADMAKADAKITNHNSTKRLDDKQQHRIRTKGKWCFMYQWWAAIYHTDFIRKNHIHFPADLISGQDIVFLTECIKNTHSVSLCPDTFYHYVRRDNSLDEQILPPHKIKSKIKAMQMIFDMYNHADMTDDDYLFCYNDRFNQLKAFFWRNTSRECHEWVARAMVESYVACKNKFDFVDVHSKFDSRNAGYIEYLQSHDWRGLQNYLENMEINADSAWLNSGVCTTKIISLMAAIPVLKIKKDSNYTTVKLFGVLDLFKIKHTPSELRLIVLYVPIVRIKSK